MASLEVCNPVAPTSSASVTPAPRPTTLDGKAIGLYWNYKQGGDVALARVEELLRRRFPAARFVRCDGELGMVMKHMTTAQADQLGAELDAVVGTTSDCGSCTAWLVRDMIELEKRGVPSVSYTSDAFVHDAFQSAKAFGMHSLRIARVPLPLTNQSPDAVCRMVDDSIEQVVAGLTDNTHVEDPHKLVHFTDEERLTFTGATDLEAWDDMNRTFIDYGWSDGFPLVAPTPEKVEWMLTGTSRDPDELIALMEPGFGRATPRMIAANAVMAGCRPNHLAVVIAAVECLTDPDMTLRVKAMSTGPAFPFVLVNGPLTEAAGINVGICALGPGSPSYANTAIGRAVRLCMMNVGHAYPGLTDMDTIGAASKYGMCFGENVARSPWEPYHVEKGFDEEDSTVTVMFGYGSSDLQNLQSHRAEDLVRTYVSAALNAGPASTGLWLTGRRGDPRYTDRASEREHHMVLIAPDHAKVFADAGWTKADIRQALFRDARLTFEQLALRWEPEAIRAANPDLAWLWESDQTMLPVLETVDCWDLVVLGGSAGRSTFVWGSGHAITRRVEV